MKLKPLQDWAVIQRLEPAEKTVGGIIIPESAKEKPTEGIVLDIGPGKYETEKGREKEKEKKKEKKFIPTVLKPGQRIIYGKYSAREIEVDGETITLVREEDILGIVEEDQLAERRSFEVAEKHEKPLAVQKDVSASKPSPKPGIKKEKPATKADKKPSQGGKKVIEKKAATKKSAVKKATPKTAKQTTTVKKAKTAPKKAAVKKTTPKKTTAKKTTAKKTTAKKTTPKKTTQKKTSVSPKETVRKKTAVKAAKKAVPTKAVTAKKKQTAKKPLAKGKASPKK